MGVAFSDSSLAAEARLETILQRLYAFYDKEIDLSLDRVRGLLRCLGDPHLSLPPVVHVAGTNGKGSVVATLRALLEASGYRVHVATSPHLAHATERIRLAGELISTPDMVAVLEETLVANDGAPATFFEIFMAATFLAFSRMPADFTLLETGLGGRFDASNVIPDPVVTVITVISRDHSEFLGSELTQIAFEKAGIMKAGVPCVIGRQTPEALDSGVMDVFQDVSSGLSTGANLVRYGSEWSIASDGEMMRFCFDDESYLLPCPNLCGSHQIDNAGAALAAYRVITGLRKEIAFDTEKLSTGLRQIVWPGRLQRLEGHPVAGLLPPGWELWCDGGHNDSAGAVLAAQAAVWAQEDGKPLHLVVAMVDRKDPAAFLGPLRPYAASLTVTGIPGERSSLSAQDLYDIAAPLGFAELRRADSVEEAVEGVAQGFTASPGRVLVTGSLYLIGNVLGHCPNLTLIAP